MFDIGWPELLVIAIVLIVVVGPKDLPPMLRAFGRTTAKLRSMANDFRGQFNEALRESELDEVRQTLSDARKLNPMNQIRDAVNPLKATGNEIRSDLEKSVRPDRTDGNPAPAEQAAPPEVTIPDSGMKLDDGPPPIAQPKPAATAGAGEGAPTKAAAAKPAGKPSSSAPAGKTAGKTAGKAKPAAAGKAPATAKPAAAAPGKAAAKAPTKASAGTARTRKSAKDKA